MIPAPDDSLVKAEDINNINTQCLSLLGSHERGVVPDSYIIKGNATGAAQAQLKLPVLTRTFAYLDGFSLSKKKNSHAIQLQFIHL